jgi:hypothetical protein
MNLPKCGELDYIHFLIAAQKVFTCTEAARCTFQKTYLIILSHLLQGSAVLNSISSLALEIGGRHLCPKHT